MIRLPFFYRTYQASTANGDYSVPVCCVRRERQAVWHERKEMWNSDIMRFHTGSRCWLYMEMHGSGITDMMRRTSRYWIFIFTICWRSGCASTEMGRLFWRRPRFRIRPGRLPSFPKIIRIRRMRQIISQTNGSICFWTLISFLQNSIRITDGFQNDWLTVSENAPAVRRCRSIRLWHYWYARF